MKQLGAAFDLTATDLVGYLNCHHLSALDKAVASGALAKPKTWDPLLEVLWQRGTLHEQAYVEHLKAAGFEAVRIDGVDIDATALAATRAAMASGTPVIVQAALTHEGWSGRADILRRVETPCDLGAWSYEAIDTKLARETKAGAVLQLCMYSDLLSKVQGTAPDCMHVIVPWTEFEPQTYRFADYAAYFRKVQRGLRHAIEAQADEVTYPDPCAHCDICRWRETCEKRRRDDDHLCLVAGITELQINTLKVHGIATTKALAEMPLPLPFTPERGSLTSFERARDQARIQIEARESGTLKYELLPVEAGFGFTRLPAPSTGDVFLDFEGDPFVGEQGLEYLFGYVLAGEAGAYHAHWALTRTDEKAAFEAFVDLVMARWQQHPDLHVYHYAPYEPAALKRLMGRYGTREEQIDQMLRAGLFVDLYQIVRHGLRASVESYSIKKLEPFYGFERQAPLADANTALAAFQAHLELGDVNAITDDLKHTVRAYNEDDCRSTVALQDWLEARRAELIAGGADIPRPAPGDGTPSEALSDWQIKINALIERLTADMPAEVEERSPEQQGRWLLAYLLDWHRREDKAKWWEYFRLCDLSAEDLRDEKAGLSGLQFVETVGGTARAPIHRYRFPSQDTDMRGGESLRNLGGAALGSVADISFDNRTIDIKKRGDSAGLHPDAVFMHDQVNTQVLADSLVRLGEHVADQGLAGEGAYGPARDLLMCTAPRVRGQALIEPEETPLDAALRLCAQLEGGILPIQGPPGAGKTYVGANMIVELVRSGKKVGITANSHKVIRHLIEETIKIAEAKGVDLRACHKVTEREDPQARLTFETDNGRFLGGLGGAHQVGGGTAWLWSRADAAESVDVLFVDEAAQMSLANVLAVSQAASTVVLIGDPCQLDQPMQGSHPEGTDVSALDHILDGHHTIPADKGLFLGVTWRLHPDICAFTSELFYDGKLTSVAGTENVCLKGAGALDGAGLFYLPVPHTGNTNAAPEEADAIKTLVERLLAGSPTWIDRHGTERPVTLEDVLIITPYNAQVFEIQQRLPGSRVGTVDKFQGQEAPIAIYSTATSSHADAPRGMEFLYSLNRLNVATSRAKAMSLLVSSPYVFEAECQTPRQIQLANAFCRYLEMAREIARS